MVRILSIKFGCHLLVEDENAYETGSHTSKQHTIMRPALVKTATKVGDLGINQIVMAQGEQIAESLQGGHHTIHRIGEARHREGKCSIDGAYTHSQVHLGNQRSNQHSHSLGGDNQEEHIQHQPTEATHQGIVARAEEKQVAYHAQEREPQSVGQQFEEIKKWIFQLI